VSTSTSSPASPSRPWGTPTRRSPLRSPRRPARSSTPRTCSTPRGRSSSPSGSRPTSAGRWAGVLLQLRGGGERGGAEARASPRQAAARGQGRGRRAHRQLPRPHLGRAARHGQPGEAHPVPAARGVGDPRPPRRPGGARRRRRRAHLRGPRRGRPGRGRRPPRPRRGPPRRPGRLRPRRGPAPRRRGADGHRPARAWYGWQTTPVIPDVVSVAKALANGLPIGGIVARGAAAEAFGPGDHATTFGGGPVVCAAALAVLGSSSATAWSSGPPASAPR
jgi:hypothetical protein